MPDPQVPFWRRKAMSEMTRAEWESLCDCCGRCCLNKLIDEDTNATVFTDVGCKLLNGKSCRCRDYVHRQAKVKDCVRLTPRNVRRLKWLPPTCAYRLVAEGKDLAWWHPLVSGDPERVRLLDSCFTLVAVGSASTRADRRPCRLRASAAGLRSAAMSI